MVAVTVCEYPCGDTRLALKAIGRIFYKSIEDSFGIVARLLAGVVGFEASVVNNEAAVLKSYKIAFTVLLTAFIRRNAYLNEK